MANTPAQNTPTTESTVEKTTNTSPQNKSNKKKAVPWDQDGVNGGSSSVEIVLEWLTTGSNYQQWRGDLEEGKTKKSLCADIIELMKENGIYHRDAKGITQQISDLQTSYTTARDWRRNNSAGNPKSDAINGVRTVEVTQNALTNDPASSMATNNALNLLSSGRDVPLDSEGNEATATQRINPATTPANASTLAK
ncbi:hypothetical protein PCASD_00787 [Puccinia coronata f. sp. avenae]|uniref:Uncharacterized protein n=1 Tax=Puccinia coronata f. sp. avenae TaxID=200324 RepID=A0A2N5VPN0_9BASI|nr:hypothetical protein PCASD_00787 [Puccinia coronata f. sp. avenae]